MTRPRLTDSQAQLDAYDAAYAADRRLKDAAGDMADSLNEGVLIVGRWANGGSRHELSDSLVRWLTDSALPALRKARGEQAVRS